MRDTSAFHPELRKAAKWLPRRLPTRVIVPLDRFGKRVARLRKPRGEVVDVGPIRVYVHRPQRASSQPLPALLWIHGGGLVMGSPNQDAARLRSLADELGIVVAAVAYRLAPQHRFPTAVDDCHAALLWLAQQPGIDGSRIAIGGASAGGGLAAALALVARERGEVAPVAQILVYPMLDDRTCLRTDLDDERNFRMWTNQANRFGWESYLGVPPGSEGVSSLAAPARHDDLGGLPPAWLGIGTLDLFHDETVAYAERLRAAGVDTELVVVEGAFHAFDIARNAQVVKDFNASQARALERACAPA